MSEYVVKYPSELSIIGGNIAGLGVALNMQKQFPGVQVTVYEKEIWNKPCGALVSTEFIEMLREKHGVKLQYIHEVDGMSVTTMKGSKEVKAKIPLSLINRYDLQLAMSNAFNSNNKQGSNICLVDKKTIYRLVKSNDDNLFTPQTVVASGYSGITNELLNRKWKKNDVSQIYRFDGNCNTSGDNDRILICVDIKNSGYGWFFKGKADHVNMGYGSLQPAATNKVNYFEFLNLLSERFGIEFEQLADINPVGYGLPMPVPKGKYSYYHNQRGKCFIGVGDAIGLAHPVLGAGVEPAWQSARVLVDTWNGEKFDVSAYSKNLLKTIKATSQRRLARTACRFLRSSLFQIMPFKQKIAYLAFKYWSSFGIKDQVKYPWW